MSFCGSGGGFLGRCAQLRRERVEKHKKLLAELAAANDAADTVKVAEIRKKINRLLDDSF